MGNIVKLEENLQKKKEKLKQLHNEIEQLEKKIAEEREEATIKAIRSLHLSSKEYESLSKALSSKDVVKVLDRLYEDKKEGEVKINEDIKNMEE